MNMDDTRCAADRAEAEARLLVNVVNDLATRTAENNLGDITTKMSESALAIIARAEEAAWALDKDALCNALKASNQHSSLEISAALMGQKTAQEAWASVDDVLHEEVLLPIEENRLNAWTEALVELRRLGSGLIASS